MNVLKYSVYVISVLLIGCGTAAKTNQLSLGMTKAQVIELMGQPTSSRATGGVEYLTYKLTPGATAGQGAGCAALGVITFGIIFAGEGTCTGGRPEDYFMQFSDGKLISYGKVGDFDSTKNPTLDLNIKNR